MAALPISLRCLADSLITFCASRFSRTARYAPAKGRFGGKVTVSFDSVPRVEYLDLLSDEVTALNRDTRSLLDGLVRASSSITLRSSASSSLNRSITNPRHFSHSDACNAVAALTFTSKASDLSRSKVAEMRTDL